MNQKKFDWYFTQKAVGLFPSVVLPIGEHKQYPLKHFNGSEHGGLSDPHVSLNALTNHNKFHIHSIKYLTKSFVNKYK